MNLRRWILVGMLSITIGWMMGVYLFWQGEVQATASIILGVLVMAANGWEWFKGGEKANQVLLRRIILLVMAVIAFGLMIAASGNEVGKVVKFLCTIYAVPVILVNLGEVLLTLFPDVGPMTRRRKILLGLLAVAGLIGASYSIWPDVWLEYGFYIFGVPVILANGLEWLDPEFMEKLGKVFGKRAMN